MIKILKKYYQEQLGIDGTFTIKPEKECKYDYYDENHYVCSLKIIMKKEIELLGEKHVCETELTENDLKEALKYYIYKDGYEVKSIKIDKGVETVWKGYGYNEYQEQLPYFHGAEVEINEKVKKIGGMR